MNFPRFSCSALIALLSLPALTIAQVQEATATTGPVGFQSTEVPVGTTAVANPLVNPNIVQAAVASNTASVVTVSGVSNVGALLSDGEPYYLEVVNGALAGERFDLDTAATKTAANGTVVINAASANNTTALTEGGLGSSQVVVRKHVTLEQIQGFFSPALSGNNNPASADQVALYNPTTGTTTTYFLRGDNTSWRQSGTTNSANKLPVPSGSGFFVTKRTAPTTYTSVGSVRTNHFAFPMPQGSSFRAPGFPVTYSPTSLGGTASEGWTGNNNPALADQLQVFNPSTGTFSSYFLRGDGVTWRQSGTTNNVTSSQILADNRPFMVLRRQGDQNYILPSPVQN
jgi:hypothetical protein